MTSDPKKTFLQSIMQNAGDAAVNAGKFLLDPAINTANDIGAGISANTTSNARNAANSYADKQASLLEQQASAAKAQGDWEKVKTLSQTANNIRSAQSQAAADVSKTFSPDINQNPWLRGLNSGAAIATTADMAAHPISTIKAPFQLASGGLKAIGRLSKASGGDVLRGIEAMPGLTRQFIQNDLSKSFRLPDKPIPIQSAPANWTSEGMKEQLAKTNPEFTALGVVPKAKGELAAGKTDKVPQNVIDTFMSQLDVPTKRMYRIDGDRVAQTVLSDGISTNFNSLKNYSNTITGKNGELPKMIYRALGDQNQPLELKDIVNSGLSRLDEIPSLGDNGGQLQKYKAEMTKMFPVQHEGSTISSAITDPLQSWEIMQQLEDYGHSYLNKSTYLTDNPHAERLGRAYLDTAKDIQDKLDQMLAHVDMNQYVTPELRQKLGSLSPKVLARFDATPKTIRNLRSFQKPAVDLSNMVRQTEASAQSVWTKNAKVLSKTLGGGIGGAIGSVGGPVGAAAGIFGGQAIASPVLEPIMEMMLKRYLPDINIAGAKIASKFAGGILPNLPGAGGLPGKLGAIGAANLADNYSPSMMPNAQQASSAQPMSTNTNTPSTSIASNDTLIKYSDIPQDVTQIKPNEQGQYIITSPQNITGKSGQPLAIPEEDYTTLKSKLQQQLGTLEVKYNPKLSAQIESQLQQLETLHDSSNKMQAGYDGAIKSANAVTSTLQTLQNAPINLFNKNQTIEGLNKAYNGKYATLAQQLQILQKYYPVMIDSILKAPSTDYAKQILSQISNQIAQDYYQGINILTGNVPGQATKQSQQSTAYPSSDIPINNGGGGTVGGDPNAANVSY